MIREFQKKANGLLVVRRINYFADTRYRSNERNSSINLSHEGIIKCYRGIEGEPWPMTDEFNILKISRGLAPMNMLKKTMEYYRNISKTYLCDLIYIAMNQSPVGHDKALNEFVFCGFDYGIYESEGNCYSSVFNEVIYGKNDELRRFGKHLNNALLFPDRDSVNDFIKARNQLLQMGADLETTEEDEEFTSISIYMKPELCMELV
jgi:hypothetical protein